MKEVEHGKVEGLTPLPFPIEGRIFRSPMPFGPFDPQRVIWPAYQRQKIGLVVVLTEEQENRVYAGGDLLAHYRDQGLEVIHLPVPDFGLPPDVDRFKQALSDVQQAGESGEKIAVHCLAGIGRTGTFLACLAARIQSLPGKQAIQWVRRFIPQALENRQQEKFVEQFAAANLEDELSNPVRGEE